MKNEYEITVEIKDALERLLKKHEHRKAAAHSNLTSKVKRVEVDDDTIDDETTVIEAIREKIPEFITMIESLGCETDVKKLSKVESYVEAMTAVLDTPAYLCASLLIEKAVSSLDGVESPSSPPIIGFIYHLFGQILLDVLTNEELGKICLHKALDVFLSTMPDLSSSTHGCNCCVLDCIQCMVNHIDIDPKHPSLKDAEGNTLLHWIGIHGDEYLDLAVYCIDKGAILDAINNDTYQMTPLHLACNNNHRGLVQFFTRHGAAVEKKFILGFTDLIVASGKGFLNVVQCLVEHGAKVETCNNDGWTALHVSTEHIEVVRFLSNQASNVDLRDNKGWTPLHVACRNNFFDVVQCLVEHKAGVNEICNDGTTPLQLGSDYNCFEIVKYLIQSGADVGVSNEYGMTALHFASAMNNLSIVEVLIENGATKDVKNKDGMTALHLAVSFGRVKIVNYLLGNVEVPTTTTKNSDRTEGTFPALCTKEHSDVLEYNFDSDSDSDIEGDWVIKRSVTLSGSALRQYLNRTSNDDDNGDSDEDTNCNNDIMTTIELAIKSGHSDIVRDLIEKYMLKQE
jgi:ankyrin repeat protein